EMSHIRSLNFVHFENGEELMVTQFEERVALATAHLFEIEHILVKGHRLPDIIHFDGDMIASIDLHAHMSAYLKNRRCAAVFSPLNRAPYQFRAVRAADLVILIPQSGEESQIICFHTPTQRVIRDVSLSST